MFSYYGSKGKIVDYYPPPKNKIVIEPFAGSARYALKYWKNDVVINEKYDVVFKVWKYLQKCEIADINNLPKIEDGKTLNDYEFDCIEAKWLMGFCIKGGSNSPRITPSEKGFGGGYMHQLENIKKHLHKIKHWQITNLDYSELENLEATWFIDPPYEFGGEHYVESTKNIDFAKLGEWCKSRNGQVIVCENTKATWLPFKPMKEMQGSQHKTTEAIWSNIPTNYDCEQILLQF